MIIITAIGWNCKINEIKCARRVWWSTVSNQPMSTWTAPERCTLNSDLFHVDVARLFIVDSSLRSIITISFFIFHAFRVRCTALFINISGSRCAARSRRVAVFGFPTRSNCSIHNVYIVDIWEVRSVGKMFGFGFPLAGRNFERVVHCSNESCPLNVHPECN